MKIDFLLIIFNVRKKEIVNLYQLYYEFAPM